MASVAMNGTTRPYAISTPLTSPQPAPTARAAKTMAAQPKLLAIAWVARVVHQTEDRAKIAPTDRSMPPPVTTKVMPTLTTPITAASRRMVKTLLMSAKRSPAVITPAMQSRTRATTRPRLRPAAVCSSERAELRPLARSVSTGTARAGSWLPGPSPSGSLATSADPGSVIPDFLP